MTTGTRNPKSNEDAQAKEALDKAKEAGAQAADKAKEGLQKARDAGMQAVDKAKEAVASVGEMATHAATAVGHKADDLTATAGADIKKWGDAISEKAPHEGVVGHASQAVAETIREGGNYIEHAKLSGMADDVTQLIRRNPIPALLVGISVGFLLGRASRV